jgi:peptide-methionine (S)-S-oxide reductase
MSNAIIFGGGCFWCMEAVFQMLRGVTSVTSGYMGGAKPHPTYDEVSSGTSGHAEVVRVTFDPEIVSLRDLLAVFFTTHDPTSLNRQGNDAGTQYRSSIFYTSSEQEKIIRDYTAELTQEGVFKKPIVTEIVSATDFYKAEDYHQNYYKNNSEMGYCQAVINPKLAKLRQSYAHLLV